MDRISDEERLRIADLLAEDAPRVARRCQEFTEWYVQRPRSQNRRQPGVDQTRA
jgi:hypothetical protein